METAHRVVFLSRDTESERIIIMHVWFAPPSRFVLLSACKSCTCQLARSWSIPVSTHSDFAVFPHENVCQPSSLQSKFRSIKTRLSRLQTVIDGQESRQTLDKMSKTPQILIGHEPLHTTVGSLAVGLRRNHVEASMSWNRVTLQTNKHGSVARSEAHCPDDVRLDTVIGINARSSENDVTSEKQRLHGRSGEGHDCRSRGGGSSKEEGSTRASNATISSGTPVHREISTPPSPRFSPITRRWRLFCREHPSDGKDESTTGEWSDDGRGLVKNLSGRLAKKLQRSASLVKALRKIHTVLDAAVVDRCDLVKICCSDTPCLTEAMPHRGISAFSLLRSDGVGNQNAQTREKLLGW